MKPSSRETIPTISAVVREGVRLAFEGNPPGRPADWLGTRGVEP